MAAIRVSVRGIIGAVLASVLVSACADEDEAPVAFIDLRAEDITADSAVVRFETSRPTTCEVEYGIEVATLDLTAVDPSMGGTQYALDHQVPLLDLRPETVYHYRARATDEAGRTYRSGAQTFSTPAAVGRPRNVARLSDGSRVVGVSSNFGGGGDDSTWGANHAFDGLMATEWATDGDGDAAWVELELPVATRLTGVGFQSRRMADDSSIITSLELTFDGSSTTGPFQTPDWSTFYTFSFAPVTARRVRIDALTTTGGNTGAREIELYSE